MIASRRRDIGAGSKALESDGIEQSPEREIVSLPVVFGVVDALPVSSRAMGTLTDRPPGRLPADKQVRGNLCAHFQADSPPARPLTLKEYTGRFAAHPGGTKLGPAGPLVGGTVGGGLAVCGELADSGCAGGEAYGGVPPAATETLWSV